MTAMCCRRACWSAEWREVYRAAFSGAAACAERLAAMGADETQLCYLLLSGQTVPAVATMNAGELYTFPAAHVYARAVEDRAIAVEALHVLRKAHPLLFALYGPTCFMTGHCPEGQDVLRPAGRDPAAVSVKQNIRFRTAG